VSAACSGFVYAMEVGRHFVAAGAAERALVVGAEVPSRFIDYTDRNTCVLFGDGAGAVVLERARNPDHGVLFGKLCTDGNGWDMLFIPAGGSRTPASEAALKARGHYMRMQGQELFKFVVRTMPLMMEEMLTANGLRIDDVRLIIPHQVNYRIFKAAAERFGIDESRIYSNLDRFGNTSAASIPIALDEIARGGALAGRSSLPEPAAAGAPEEGAQPLGKGQTARLRGRSRSRLAEAGSGGARAGEAKARGGGVADGDLIMLLGFGAGLTWGSILMRWGR
jgi:3-oxoacyl-[acyl-carrier-protein] synthase-3